MSESRSALHCSRPFGYPLFRDIITDEQTANTQAVLIVHSPADKICCGPSLPTMLGWLIGAVSNISYSAIDSSKVSLPKSLASLAELLPHLEKKTFENHQVLFLGEL